mgnify:CR=1 FL=1
MLRTLSPLLSPDLLHALASMGHGDDIVIADANFPAHSCGTRVIRLEGASATDTLAAVLSLLPLDAFVPNPALSMEIVGEPDQIPDIVQEFQAIIHSSADTPAKIQPCERFAFYEKAKTAFAVIQTGETRIYGNIILKKGVVMPEGDT